VAVSWDYTITKVWINCKSPTSAVETGASLWVDLVDIVTISILAAADGPTSVWAFAFRNRVADGTRLCGVVECDLSFEL
jgi:hypothetical protein